jgi:hypothetical protein
MRRGHEAPEVPPKREAHRRVRTGFNEAAATMLRKVGAVSNILSLATGFNEAAATMLRKDPLEYI